MQAKRIIISAGGTGGHIFPALAVAGELKKRLPSSDILFVGALEKMEMERVPAAGFRIIGLPVMGFPRKPGIKWLKFLWMLVRSSRSARRIIKDFDPHVAAGFGGYASGPVLRAAAQKKVPALIQEQNSYAGITNKLLGKRVLKICVAYENMKNFFPENKIVLTGNPVREALLSGLPGKTEACDFFNLNPARQVILIIGGSLGARSINDAVLKNIDGIKNAEINVIWQTGELYYDEMIQKTSGKTPANLQIHKFLTRMDMAYGAADVIVSRAGAGTISELCVVGKPILLVPSPNVAEDHQTKNAVALAQKNAAVQVSDEKIGEVLLEATFQLLNDKNRLEELSRNIKKMAKPDATKKIVDEIIGIMK